MKYKLFYLLLILFPVFIHAQTETNTQKKSLSFDDYDGWQYLEHPAVSDDGKWVVYEVNPYLGDGKLYISYPKKNKLQTFERGYSAKIAPNSDFVAFKIKAQRDTIRKLKLKR